VHDVRESRVNQLVDGTRAATLRDRSGTGAAAGALRAGVVMAFCRWLVARWRFAQAQRVALPSFPIREFGRWGRVRRRADVVTTPTLHRLRGDS